MPRYSVAGRSASTAATIDHAGAALWNPASAQRLRVLVVEFALPGGGAHEIALVRITTRGTPGSTVTPDLDNDYARVLTPSSGAVLDLAAYSVQPTVAGPYMHRFNNSNVAGGAISWVFKHPIIVPGGTGLAIVTTAALLIPASDITYTWNE